MNIFLARNNVQAGPYSLEQLNQMLTSGQVLLTDLMWHEGMDNWRPVTEMTQGQFVYRPAFTVTTSPTHQQDNDDDYIINNTPSAAQSAPTNDTDADSQTIWDKYASNNPYRAAKGDHTIKTMDISAANKKLDLASVGSRILAKLIDFLLILLPNLILLLNLRGSEDFDKFTALVQSNELNIKVYEQMNDLLMNAVPMHIITLSQLLFWAIIVSQILLLVKRGQSIGKLVTGIRVLKMQSNAIPKFSDFFIRGIFFVVYFLSLFGLIVMVIDFITMLNNPDRQSLHDKLAKTYVVRADDTQTTPLELKPE